MGVRTMQTDPARRKEDGIDVTLPVLKAQEVIKSTRKGNKSAKKKKSRTADSANAYQTWSVQSSTNLDSYPAALQSSVNALDHSPHLPWRVSSSLDV
jgi:hypothetical protein